MACFLLLMVLCPIGWRCRQRQKLAGQRTYMTFGMDSSGIVINLASKEYSRCVEKYIKKEERLINVIFCEMSKGKLVTKGTYAKMARGAMVRFMAENQVEGPEGIKDFDCLGYVFQEDLSDLCSFVFERVKFENT